MNSINFSRVKDIAHKMKDSSVVKSLILADPDSMTREQALAKMETYLRILDRELGK